MRKYYNSILTHIAVRYAVTVPSEGLEFNKFKIKTINLQSEEKNVEQKTNAE